MSSPITSFYQFYEHIQQSKLNESVLLEMRPQGEPSQYGNVTPFHPITGTDGYKGQSQKKLVDAGADKDRILRQQSWDNSVEERPELDSYTQAKDELSRERAIDRRSQPALKSLKGDRRGGGVKQDISQKDRKGPEDIEAIASKNRGLSYLITQFDTVKGKMDEIRPTVTDSDPQMKFLIKKLYAITSAIQKNGMLTGEKADEIEVMHNKMAKLIYMEKKRSLEDL